MKNSQIVSVPFALLIAVSGCGGSKAEPLLGSSAATSGKSARVELAPQEYSRDRAAFGSSAISKNASASIDVESYALEASFNEINQTLTGNLDVKLRVLSPTREIALDSNVDEILSVSAPQDARSLGFESSEGKLRIQLPEELSPSSALLLNVRYRTRAAKGRALTYVAARKGDPVQVPALFTSSEPRDASEWLPSNDRPDDRARFSLRFRMKPDESLIANGALIEDRVANGQRIMAYETAYSLPTYIMAFAHGRFETASRRHGDKTISIWARKGLRTDLSGLLSATEDQIKHFEKLIGPYPFEKYAVVLLPDFSGGMENASITFNDEERSSQGLNPSDLSLMAHELGHQWFGDYVTVAAWDDIWIKEGMATLLAAESARAYEDSRDSGRLFGSYFSFLKGQAVRDVSLPPEMKYNSGPYDRSAWFLTQIRSLVGEDAFWATLRGLLAAHAFGTISSDEFLEAFRAPLGEALFNQARFALDAKGVPTLDIRSAADEGKLTVSIIDPDRTLLAPLEIRRYIRDSRTGSIATKSDYLRGEGQPVLLPTPSVGSLFVADPSDTHPSLETFLTGDDSISEEYLARFERYASLLAPSLVPAESWSREIFTTLAPHAQHQALEAFDGDTYDRWAGFTLEEARAVSEQSGSSSLRNRWIGLACWLQERASSQEQSGWRSWLRSALRHPDYRGMNRSSIINQCAVHAAEALDSEFSDLAAGASLASVPEVRLEYLSRMPLAFERTLVAWLPVALRGDTSRSRTLGAATLARLLRSQLGTGTVLDSATSENWRTQTRLLLSSSRVRRTVGSSLELIDLLGDVQARPLLAELIMDPSVHLVNRVNAACVSYRVDPSTYADFVARLGAIPASAGSLQHTIDNASTACAR